MATAAPQMASRAATSIPKVKASYEALADALKGIRSPKRIDMHVRKAVENGDLDAVLRCVQRPQRSKITLKTPGVMEQSLRGLRLYPERAQWSEESIVMALRRSKAIATLLDSDNSGFGKTLTTDDPRSKPHLLGTYLELIAVDATKHKKDQREAVKTAADRLLSVLADKPELKETEWALPKAGSPAVVLDNLPVWNGLVLAQKLLGNEMPRAAIANEIIESYGSKLSSLVDTLKARSPKEDSYDMGAIKAWESRQTLQKEV